MVIRAMLPEMSLLYSLFANLYLAGTVIFGGGAVLVPFLREYVVAEGWVSPRDFLIGLAVIQAFPGPQSNIVVYLGGLAAMSGESTAVLGATLGFVSIFAPALIMCHGTIGVWCAVRGMRLMNSALRGLHAAAIGLIFTGVYRLWQFGYIDADVVKGTSLARGPWWVVVTATSYVGSCWFGLSPPFAVALGGIMGLVWYGVVIV